MTDGAGLLAAILANPADNNVRLVYADWLQEQGEEARAEFIRVQVEIARLREPELKTFTPIGVTDPTEIERQQCVLCRRGPVCQFHVLRACGRELLHAGHHWQEWAGPAINVVPGAALYYDHLQFTRGFVESLTCSAADWLTHADAILAAHPVARVTLTTLLDDHLQMRRWPARWPKIRFELPSHVAV